MPRRRLDFLASHAVIVVVVLLLRMIPRGTLGFAATTTLRTTPSSPSFSSWILQSSFASDGSEYSSSPGTNDGGASDDPVDTAASYYRDNDDDDATPTVELSPVPMSKNAGNRFVAVYWDAELNPQKDAWEHHYDRIALTEPHVLFCRKTNLYNTTFNAESMVDVLWSLPILSSDLKRLIGHAVCVESTALHHVQEFLRNEPLSQMLLGNDSPALPALYRWRHVRDYTLRMDDGRNGFPCLCVGLDTSAEQDAEIPALRASLQNDLLDYWIRSERIIAAGPLHLPTEYKDDPSSWAVGDLMLFNAADRDDAVQFVQDMPTAQAGLYADLRVHFYNTLDITGKSVSEDPLRDAPCADMKEAMEVWGYPVEDEQTPWLNW